MSNLWAKKLAQDTRGLPRQQRHRNLEPDSAEFLCALAAGCRARTLLEIGGSSGLSTIALAAAARYTGGRLVSLEIEPVRQDEARRTLTELGLLDRVDLVLADAASILDRYEVL
jgi:predicted O-methyltransferase YrrM